MSRSSKKPAEALDKRPSSEHVFLTSDQVLYSPKDISGIPFDLGAFKKRFNLGIGKIAKNFMELDLVGIDAPVANAIRRILISEVSTMAIEHVYVVNNTSIVADEVLAHRLGLVPIHADPRHFEARTAAEEPTDVNTLVFELTAKCARNPSTPKDETDPSKKYEGSNVYSSALRWVPQGAQAELFKDDPPRPTHDDILIAKLRPGQEIDLELHAVKNNGREHAKWSPVATASYRLFPQITITEPIVGEDARRFQKCFPEGVIEIIKSEKTDVLSAKVANPRLDTVSRECLRHPEFVNRVVLSRIPDHFIYQIETTGFYTAEQVFVEGLNVMLDKCARLLQSIDNL